MADLNLTDLKKILPLVYLKSFNRDMKIDKDRFQGESEGAGINIWRKAK